MALNHSASSNNYFFSQSPSAYLTIVKARPNMKCLLLGIMPILPNTRSYSIRKSFSKTLMLLIFAPVHRQTIILFAHLLTAYLLIVNARPTMKYFLLVAKLSNTKTDSIKDHF